MRLIVFDTEAASQAPESVCQLAWLTAEGERVRGENRFFRADEVSPEALAVHGMTAEALETLSGGERFADRAGEILAAFSRVELLIGHNVSADLRRLRAALAQAGLALPDIPALCTMNRLTAAVNLKRRYGRGPKPPKLSELCAHYGLSEAFIAQKRDLWFDGSGAFHDARFDAAATYLCLLAAIEAGDLALPAGAASSRR